jgi:amino acid transporter
MISDYLILIGKISPIDDTSECAYSKSMSQPKASTKTIGLLSCVAFAVGSMVGAGVFVLSGLAIQKAGPAALISFMLAGAAVLCSAFSFMVIASLARKGELGYAPVGRILGHRFWGFLTAWAFYLAAIIGMAFVLHGFGVYAQEFFMKSVPASIWAIIATVCLTLLNLGPASRIGKIESLLVFTKVGILLLLVGFGLVHLTTGDLRPFTPHGMDSMFVTSGMLFIAYLGFSVVTNIAGDVENPRRTVPRAILISILVVIALYAGIVLALISMPLASYNEGSIGRVAIDLMGPIGGMLIPLAALISTLSAANSNILGSSEIMVRLAARGDIPTFIGRMKYGHPTVSVLFGAALCLVLLVSGQMTTIIALANVAAISAIILINLAAMRTLYIKNSQAMRLPGGALLPILGLLSCVGELALLGILPVTFGLSLVGLGGIVYLGRKYFHHPAHHHQLNAELKSHGGPIIRVLGKDISR